MIACGQFVRVVAVTIFSAAIPSIAAENATLPIHASAKVLPSLPTTAPQMIEMPREQKIATAPTTPGGKLPQYQLGHQQRQLPKTDDSSSPRVRIVLSLPQGPILVEAAMTIDGLPFRRVREQKIEQLLNAMKAQVASENRPTDNKLGTSSLKTNFTNSEFPTLADRLVKTMQVTGQFPTADEAQWILSNWIEGPTVLLLNDNFQRFRAQQRPEFVVLDRNHDGTVSSDELHLAVQSIQECDLNRDEIVQFTEIAVVAATQRVPPNQIEPGHILTLLLETVSAENIYERIATSHTPDGLADPGTASRFDRNRNGQFDPDELKMMLEGPSDLNFQIAFDSMTPEKSRITLTSASAEFTETIQNVATDDTEIAIPLCGTTVIFTVVQQQASDQISIGGVCDGYPLLPSLDPNDDGRLTTRELRQLIQTLRTFDQNQDGTLTFEETQAPVRVCFGLGPIVHRELAGIRSIGHKSKTSPIVGPEWFVRMDRNKDNDVSRGEFPGTDEQFQTLDTDRDQLISAVEAIAFDAKSDNAANADVDPLAKPPVEPTTQPNSQEETSP